MQRSVHLPQKIIPLGFFSQQRPRLMGSKQSRKASAQHSSPAQSSDVQGKVRSSKEKKSAVYNGDQGKSKASEHQIDIGDEQCNLLGVELFSGKLALEKKPENSNSNEGDTNRNSVDAKLTTKALFWGSHVLCLQDVISVSFSWVLSKPIIWMTFSQSFPNAVCFSCF